MGIDLHALACRLVVSTHTMLSWHQFEGDLRPEAGHEVLEGFLSIDLAQQVVVLRHGPLALEDRAHACHRSARRLQEFKHWHLLSLDTHQRTMMDQVISC